MRASTEEDIVTGAATAPNVSATGGYHHCVTRRDVHLSWRFPGYLAGCWLALQLTAGCSREPSSPPPTPWTGFFHPPGKPGGSITNWKQCSCRACDPGSCCQAEQTESLGALAPECSTSYTFSEKCGITVQTCTPRCYEHVWRVPKQDSCTDDRPLVCCQ